MDDKLDFRKTKKQTDRLASRNPRLLSHSHPGTRPDIRATRRGQMRHQQVIIHRGIVESTVTDTSIQFPRRACCNSEALQNLCTEYKGHISWKHDP